MLWWKSWGTLNMAHSGCGSKYIASPSPTINKMSKQQPGSGSLKDLEQKRREVFKPILDNPYTNGTAWPQVTPQVSRSIMEYLMQLLSSYGEHRKLQKSHAKVPPHVLDAKITIGFNSTVKALEDQAAPMRAKMLKSHKQKQEQQKREKKKSNDKKHTTEENTPYTKYVFVARADVTSPLLTSCFPLLTFSASRSLQDRVKLIELPRGALDKLLAVLHAEKTCFVSLTNDWAEAAPLFSLIDSSIADVQVPWLEGIFTGANVSAVYEKPDIRFLKTLAPVGKPKKSQKKGKRSLEEKNSLEEKKSLEEAEKSKKPKLERGQ